MISHTHCVAFSGIDVQKIIIEVQISKGLPAFSLVGLADKAVAESRERIRSALHALGMSLPAAHITVNLAPADVIKEGTHFDLPIIMALLAAMGIVDPQNVYAYMMMGELGLDASIRPVAGILPGSVAAKRFDLGFVCPFSQGSEAAWSGNDSILAPKSLLELIDHFRGKNLLPPPQPASVETELSFPDFKDIKGQETAKRVLEIAAVGGHNVLMIGPPGSGKSMLASRFSSILPPMTSEEILEVSQIHSVVGLLRDGHLVTTRPFRAPHHSSSMPALVGGGLRSRPGEISLAHGGVLFLDELPEFARTALEALRQPLETGIVTVARANAHITYPACFQLLAAMNPCRCGYFGTPGHECAKAPQCAINYQSKLSGPLLDRIDLHIDVPAVAPWELAHMTGKETSAEISARVLRALAFSQERFKSTPVKRNAQADGELLETVCPMEEKAQTCLIKAAERLRLSARGYHRMMRVARSIADLELSEIISEYHMLEALSYRKQSLSKIDTL